MMWWTRTEALAEALNPWLGRAWKSSWGGEGTYGRLRVGARTPFWAAYRWLHDEDGWKKDMPAGLEYQQPQWMWYDRVKSSYCLAKFLQEDLLAGPLISIPEDTRPPPYGRVKEGVLVRLLVEGIEAQLAAGRALEAALAEGVSERSGTRTWSENVAKVLDGLTPNIGAGFTRITSGAAACDNPLFRESGVLGGAYLALGLAYLEEVRKRVSDYAEASGQAAPEPKVSMTFSGNTIYGGQFAAQIANIDSTIAGVVRQGDADVADALKALEQAVLSQGGLDEEQRLDLLDNVAYLAEAAQAPPAKRNRGILKSVLTVLRTASTSGEELGRAMATWGDVLNGLLP